MPSDFNDSTSNRPILMLAGLGNSGPMHWQSQWEKALPSAKRVQQRDWERPHCVDWCEAIEHAVQDCPVPPIVVAHSLGCLALAHWAARSASDLAAALLVAVPDPLGQAFPKHAQGFVPLPSELLPFPTILVASSNDEYASVAFAAQCAKAWGSHRVMVGALGHLNAASGLGNWDFGLSLLAELRTLIALE